MVDTHGVQPFNFSGFAFRISCRYALRCDLDVENPRVSEMIRCPGLCSPSAGISRRLSRPGVELAEPFSPVMADDTNSNSRTLWGRIHALHPRLEACHSSLRSQLLSVTGRPNPATTPANVQSGRTMGWCVDQERGCAKQSRAFTPGGSAWASRANGHGSGWRSPRPPPDP